MSARSASTSPPPRLTPNLTRRSTNCETASTPPAPTCKQQPPLLAYNAELDLARALSTYLTDPGEYRAITRHLLHQPGHIHYTPASITVTIDKPHAPRIARARNLLIDQLNNNPPKLPGDTRKILYSIATT